MASSSGAGGGGGGGGALDPPPSLEEEIKAPLVFFCMKCKVIVGDSYSFLSSNEEMQTITLTAASNLQRAADVYTSKAGRDIGSTYFNFTCMSCQATLGRYYLTTSRDLDDLREKFTFAVKEIGSYQLGKVQHGKMPDAAPESNSSSSSSSSSGGGGGGQEDEEAGSGDENDEEGGGRGEGGGGGANGRQKVNWSTVRGNTEDIFKIQHVLMGLVERMTLLEHQVSITQQQHHHQQQQQQQQHHHPQQSHEQHGNGGGGNGKRRK